MTIRRTLSAASARLAAAGVPDSAYDAQAMLAHVLGEDRLRMRAEADREVPQEAAARYGAMLARRERREPLQYILGETEFMGLVFHVEPGVLIPRFDTEVLCEEALRRLAGKKCRVLDIGTGSGAIAVSIAKLAPACEVTAVDISEDALRVARGNAAANGVQVRFVRSDCLDALRGETFDMILSNPPYIDDGEMGTLMPEVLCEPELALRGGADGLDFYRRISREARDCLAPGGCLLFEIGWKQKEAVEALLREAIGEPFALRDYGNNWRVVGAALPVAGGDSLP